MNVARRSIASLCMGGVLASMAVTATGCLQSGGDPDVPGARLELAVAPLSLPNIGQACYAIRVTNAAGTMGDIVWQDGDPTNAPATTVGMAQSDGAL